MHSVYCFWSTYIALISTIIHKLSCVIWACNLSCCISTRMLVTKQLKGQLRWPVISSAIATWSFVTEGHVIGDIANSQLPENLGFRWQLRMISHVIWWRIDWSHMQCLQGSVSLTYRVSTMHFIVQVVFEVLGMYPRSLGEESWWILQNGNDLETISPLHFELNLPTKSISFVRMW